MLNKFIRTGLLVLGERLPVLTIFLRKYRTQPTKSNFEKAQAINISTVCEWNRNHNLLTGHFLEIFSIISANFFTTLSVCLLCAYESKVFLRTSSFYGQFTEIILSIKYLIAFVSFLIKEIEVKGL